MFTKKFRKKISMMLSVFTIICVVGTLFSPIAFARDSATTTYTGNTAYTYDGFGVSSVSGAVDGSTSTVWSAGYHDRSTPIRIFIDRGATNGTKYFNEVKINYSVPNVQGVYVYAGSSFDGTLPSSSATALSSDFDLNYDDRYLVAKDEVTELTPAGSTKEINLTFPACNKRYIIIEQYVSMDFDKTDAYNLAVSDISFIFNDPGDVTGIGAYYKSSSELSGFVANYENDFMFKAHAEHYNGTSYIGLEDENLFRWTIDSVTPGTNANTASGADAYDCPTTTPTIDVKTAVVTVPKKWYGTFTVKCTALHDGSSATREYVVHQGNAQTGDVTTSTDIAWAASGWGQASASQLIDDKYNTSNYWSPGAHTGAGNGVTVDLGSTERFNYVDLKVASWDTAGFKIEAADALSGTAPTASNTESSIVPKTSDSTYQKYTHNLTEAKISSATPTSTENLYFPIQTMSGRYVRFSNIYGSNASDTSVKSQTLAPRFSELALSYMPASSIKLTVSGSNSTTSSAGYKNGFIKTVNTSGTETSGGAIYYEADGSTKVYIKIDTIKGGFASSNSPYLSRTIVNSDRTETDPTMLKELKWWLGEDGLYGKNVTSLNGVNLTTNTANDTANLEFTADCVPHTLVLNCAWVDPNKQFRTVIQQMRIPVVYHGIRQYDVDQYFTDNGYGGITATNALNGIDGFEYSGEELSANNTWSFGAHSVSKKGLFFHTNNMRSAVNKAKLSFSSFNTKGISLHSVASASFPSTTDTTQWRDSSYDTSHQLASSAQDFLPVYDSNGDLVNEAGSVFFYGSMVNIPPTATDGSDRYDLVNGGEFLHNVYVPLNSLTTDPYWSVQVHSALSNNTGTYDYNRLFNVGLYKVDLENTYLYGIPASYTQGSYDTETLKPYAKSIDGEGDEMKAITYTWSLTEAPAGVSIDSSTGEISFGGTENGTVTVSVSASDGSTTKTASKSFELTVPVVTDATVTVYQSGTSTVLWSTTVTSGSTFDLSTAEANITVPNNIILSGFYVGSDNGTLRPNSYSFTVSGNTAIYAKFEYEEYAIYFSDSSASGLPSTIYGLTALDTYSDVYSSNNIASYTPTKAGCRFEGWTLTKGSTTEFNWSVTSITNDTYLYPIWYTYQTGANLSNVKINNTTATASGTSYSIDYEFPYSVSSVPVSVTLASDSTKATITINGSVVTSGASKSVTLVEGTNEITVVVTPESPEVSSSTYTIVIEKLSASDALGLEIGSSDVLPSTSGSVATATIRAGGATVDTDFVGTDITFSFNNTMFSFNPSVDIEWNSALSVDSANTSCTSSDDGNITSVVISLSLTDAENIAAGDYLDLADINLTLLEDIDINYTLAVSDASYKFDTTSDAAEYSSIYSRLIFVVQKPVVTGYEFTSIGGKFSIFSGTTRQTVSVINVTGNNSNPDFPQDYDMENDNVFVSYMWYRDGVPTGVTDSSYTLTSADVGKKIEVKITLTDNDLAQTGSETVTVFNTVFRRGDANLSGTVDISDATYLKQLWNGDITITNENSTHLYNGGVDDPYKDGQLTAFDITSILQKRLRLITDAQFDALGN